MKVSTYSFRAREGWSADFSTAVDSPKTLVTVFGDSAMLENTDAVDEIVAAFPHSKIIGCSTAGEIFGNTVEDGSLAVAVAEFERTGLKLVCESIGGIDQSFAAGKKIASALMDDRLRGVLVLSDGVNINGSRLVEGINSVLPAHVVVTGGLAGDKDQFRRTWVLHNGMPAANVVSAIGFYGEHVKIGHGSKGGWDIFGPERRVTKSAESRLFEIDGKPALEIYKSYLGEKSSELPASALFFPLSVRADAFADKRIVRTVLGVDEATNSMLFAGDIPEGHLVQLMRANVDRLIDGATEAAEMTQTTESTGDVLSIAVSCVGRRLILGERVEEELEAVIETLPAGARQVGFYSYGEISPFADGFCDLHNQTMTVTTISEK